MRALLFDFAWNVRALVHAKMMANVGHTHLWLVDAVLDVVQTHKLPASCIPALYRSWRRTDTREDPDIT